MDDAGWVAAGRYGHRDSPEPQHSRTPRKVPNAMRSYAHRHPIRTFLAIVYTATAAIFAIPFLSSAGIG